MKRPLATALALIAYLSAALALLSSSTLGASIGFPVVQVELDGKTSRSQLPVATPKPITLALEGKISKGTGTTAERPSPLTTLSLQFDKAGAIFTRGLPICRPHLGNPDWGWESCKNALVGSGEVEIEVNFPEQPVFRTKGNRLAIFNGAPQGGRPVLIYEVYAHIPAPTTFSTSAVIEKGHGKFGTRETIRIPTIVSGEGSLVGFRAKLGRAWSYQGKRVNLLTASCPKGRLFAHSEFDFINGARVTGEIVNPCGRRGRG